MMSKKILFNVFVLSFLALGFAKAQNIQFEDAIFKARLLSATPDNGIAKDVNGNAVAIDTNDDGEISYAEALNIYQLDIYEDHSGYYLDDYSGGDFIQSMKGIEHFTNLTVLSCRDLYFLKSLDVSALTKLKELYCSVWEHPGGTVSSNYLVGKLSNLILPKTQTLEVLGCSNTSITNLDFLAGITSLKKLYLDGLNLGEVNITGAQFPHLQSLSVEKGFTFPYVDTNITVSDLPELTSLNCSPINDKYMAMANNISLSNLPKISELPAFVGKTVTINNLPNLTKLDCHLWVGYASASYLHMESLILNGVPKLTEIDVTNNNLKTLDLSNVPSLVTLNATGSTTLESLNVSKNINLQTLILSWTVGDFFYYSGIKTLDVSNNKNLTNLNLYLCGGLTSLYMKNGVKKTFVADQVEAGYNLVGTNLNYICCDEDDIDAVKAHMEDVNRIGDYYYHQEDYYYHQEDIPCIPLNPTITSDCGEETPVVTLDLSTGKGSNGELLPFGVTDYNWYYTREDGTGQNPATRDAYGVGTSAAWSCPTLSSQGDIQNSVWVTGPSTDPRTGYFDYISKTFTIPAGVTDAKLDLRVLSFVRDWVYLVNEDTGTETEIARTEWFEGLTPPAAGWLNSRTPEVIGYALAPGNYHLKVHVWSQNTITHAISANAVVTYTGQEELPVLTVSNVTENGATLGWSAVAGATGYTIEYKKLAVTAAGQKSITTFADNWTTISGITATTYTLSGLADGSIYEWRLIAVGSGDETPVSGPFFTTVIKPLGTEDLSPQAKATLYPNPVKDVLYFSANGKVAKAEVYDLNGRLIKTAAVSNNSVNVSSLSKGVYFIILHTDKGTVKEKFIKN